MDFRLKIKLEKSDINISHENKLLIVGSCFSENIGERLVDSGFDTRINPFGVMFNPISVAQILKDGLNRKVFSNQDLYENKGKFHSLSHHGSFSGEKKIYLLDKINEIQSSLFEDISKTKTIIITFGSAWVYERIENEEVVANCHKLPSSFFDKRLLSIDEIVGEYESLIREFSDDVNFIFTVSPVRHWKDGAVENSRSKSVLHLAIQELAIQFENVSYFPSYEIVMDELRDYRFYTEDMLHPNKQAIDYVWSRFQSVYFSKETVSLVNRVESFNQLRNHRVLNQEMTQKHENKVLNELKELKKFLPNLKIGIHL